MKRILCLALLCALCRAGGGAPATAPTAADPSATAAPTPPASRAVVYAAQWIVSHDFTVEDYDYPTIEFIRTTEEWEALNIDCATFPPSFFRAHALLLVRLEESSGSIRHKVTEVTNDGNSLHISVQRFHPSVYTCDMAYWYLLLELPSTVPDRAEFTWEDVHEEEKK